MDLLNPDVGDVLDRATILHLKLSRKNGEAHWEDELHRLYQRLDGEHLPDVNGRVFTVRELEVVLKLMAINSAIWQLTDALQDARRLRDSAASYPESEHLPYLEGALADVQGEYGRLALALNTQRNQLVAQLNDVMGRGAQREKV